MLSEADLIERRGFLGGSESTAALGLSPYFSPLQVYKSKIGEGEPIETTLPMRMGNALEPLCLELGEEELGEPIIDRQRVFYDKDRPWRRCTVDGMLKNGAAVEAKWSGAQDAWGDAEDDVPIPYIYNAHHTMACTGAELVWFPVIIWRQPRLYKVTRNEELIKLVNEGEDRFWEHVVNRIPPEPISNDDLRILYPRDTGEIITATSEQEALVYRLAQYKAARKEAEKFEDEVSLQVKTLLRDAASLVSSTGEVLCTFKASDTTRFDVKPFRKDHPALAEQYSKTEPVRRLLVKV